MPKFFSPVVFSIGAAIMGVTVMIVRLRSSKKPASAKLILAPPLFMSTGFAMFLFPEAAAPINYHLIAFLTGMVLSIPLILSSRFEARGRDIYLKSSKSFLFILIGLFLFRLAIKFLVGDEFAPLQTAGLFFVLAFGMIVPWRLAMYLSYRRLTRKLNHIE